MKKVLVGMLALVMCLGLASCSKESGASLADVVAKAKTDGANWSVDEWKEAYKTAMEAVKPMMLEVSEITKSMQAPEGQEPDPAKLAEAMGKLQELQTKYGDVEKLMNEFEEAAKATENGKKVSEDEEWLKSVAKELGLPEDISMKLISWNVNGLRACEGKGFSDIFRQMDADFFCLQETKMQEGQLDLTFDGYKSYWNYADKKGYSGTAIFTRHEPLNVTYGLGIDEHDHEGRVITLEMPDFYLVTVYTPNSQDELRRLDYRMQWEDDFREYLLALDQKKPVIVCGDMNVAHEEIDLKNPKSNRRNAGFTDEEREKFTTLLNSGFTDTFRWLYPEQVTYSWWSYRFQARQKNAGWRIDYFVVSNRLRPSIDNARIHTDILGSDHCPVELTLK